MASFGGNIKALADMLRGAQECHDDGDIGETISNSPSSSSSASCPPVKKTGETGDDDKSNDIWTTKSCDEVKDSCPQNDDPRIKPKYEMYYRQAVSAEDMYLQLGQKTPGTASCEHLVVEISLPEDNLSKIQLNVKEQAIDVRSPIHFLYLTLPHPIDPRAGNAKWDGDKEKLIVTLHLQRELDHLNF